MDLLFFQLPVIFGLLWLMFTRKLAKITGTLKKYEYEMYDEQRLNNPGKLTSLFSISVIIIIIVSVLS